MSDGVVNREIVVSGAESGQIDELTGLLAETDGFTVEAAPAWELSDRLTAASPAAVVVVDRPPASDGVEIFREIREIAATVPVVLVGSSVEPDRVETALAAGVTDYITTGGDTLVAELTARLRAYIRYPSLDGAAEATRWAETIGTLSHDMKNPLNVVSGRLELLDIEPTHADAIERSIDRVSDLLEAVSMAGTAVTAEVDRTPLDIGETARRVWATLSSDSVTLSVTSERQLPADEGCLELLFEHLFENAIQHTDGTVTVTVGDTEAGFYVADDGPGLPDDAGDRVFEQGYGTAREGEGYGLFVASRAAAAMGWDIVAGESEDGGARFDVRVR